MAPQLFPLGPELSVAGRLDRADIDALAGAGVRTIINNRPDGEDPGQLPAAEARRLAEEEQARSEGVAADRMHIRHPHREQAEHPPRSSGRRRGRQIMVV